MRDRATAPVACEPHHSSWFGAEADQLLVAAGVARVMADPPPAPGADKPGGWRGLAYLRLHGVPRIYCSDYEADALAGFSGRLRQWQDEDRPAWCIFDKTAAFHALGNALALQASLRS